MSLKANVRTDYNGNITIHMEGGLDFENIVPFGEELNELQKLNPFSEITLDMCQVDFVGSSGIQHFTDTLKLLQQKKANVKLSNVKTEFLRVFKLYDLDPMQLLAEEFEDDQTWDLAQKFSGKKRTFEN